MKTYTLKVSPQGTWEGLNALTEPELVSLQLVVVDWLELHESKHVPETQAKLNEVTEALRSCGYDSVQCSRPAQTLRRLANTAIDRDWRDSFMAALSATGDVTVAKVRADQAVEILRTRRAQTGNET